MKFVARLTIAIATVAASAMLCWGQPPASPRRAGSGFPPLAMQPPAGARQVQYEEPASQGTWVDDSDAQYETAPMQPPGELGLGEFEIDPSYGEGGMPGGGMVDGGEGCDCEECMAGGCGDPDCADPNCAACNDPNAGHRRKCGGLCGPLWCSDLWNDVHAHRRVYVQADYLAFWTKGNLLPPLVTTSPLGTPQAQAGVLPESATTSILFGNGRVDTEQRSGGRLTVGYWLVDGEFLGVEGQYFTFQPMSTGFSATSDFSADPNSQILARPFYNVDPNLVTPRQDAAIVAFPDGFTIPGLGLTGTLNGSIDIRTTSQLESAGALLRKLVWIDFTMQRRLDLLLGYRFFRLDDSVTIRDASTFIPDGGGPTSTIEFRSQDQFSSRNFFNGGEIGLKWQSHHNRLMFEGIAKCAFGNNEQVTYINGFNTRRVGSGDPVENVGGLLAQPTNIGTHVRNTFAILPEADVNLKYDITCHLRASLGYTFLYINRVQRSGEAINTTLNPSQVDGGTLVGPAQPSFNPTDTTYWAHGVSGGVEYRW